MHVPVVRVSQLVARAGVSVSQQRAAPHRRLFAMLRRPAPYAELAILYVGCAMAGGHVRHGCPAMH